MILGCLLESIMGAKTTALIYLCSVLGQTILEGLTSRSGISYGWSPLGFIGALAAFLTVNWRALEPNQEIRCCFLMMVIFAAIFFLLNSMASSSSSYGMLGSVLDAVVATCWFGTRLNPRNNTIAGTLEKHARLFGIGGFVIMFLTCYLDFFLGLKIAKTDYLTTCNGGGFF